MSEPTIERGELAEKIYWLDFYRNVFSTMDIDLKDPPVRREAKFSIVNLIDREIAELKTVLDGMG